MSQRDRCIADAIPGPLPVHRPNLATEQMMSWLRRRKTPAATAEVFRLTRRVGGRFGSISETACTIWDTTGKSTNVGPDASDETLVR
jgi:hypothetical protein